MKKEFVYGTSEVKNILIVNRDGKDLAYEQIDEEMKKYNISREEYKSKWKGLRGQFMREKDEQIDQVCIARAMLPRKCFPVCAAWKHNIHFVCRAFARPRNIISNNVFATMCLRLPVPLASGLFERLRGS